MSASDALFQRLLKNLKPRYAAEGFLRKTQSFICGTPECWGVINFQTSQFSLPGEKTFTINLAIAAKRILEYYGEPTDAPPRTYGCHWETRIGFLMPDRQDKWWKLLDEASYAFVEDEVWSAVSELAIPLMKAHLTTQGLLALWASKTPGHFEYPNLKYKSILLAQQGRFDQLPEIFHRMREVSRGTAAEGSTGEHVAELKKRFLLP